jgi:hypothetical protein
MNEKINWMLGMTDNMMGMTLKNMEKPLMPEMYSMTSAMMGNLNQMKVMEGMGMMTGSVDMMEMMMRSMEKMMMSMDMNNDMQRMMMKNMMSYMVMMQMSMVMSMMGMMKK